MKAKSLFASIVSIVTCSLIFGQVEGAEDNGSSKVAPTTIDNYITQQMDEAGIVGLAAAILVDKKVVWMKGYGFADKERGLPFTTDSVMNIASISKTFTGLAMMRAVQEGKLSLDVDINSYLPFQVVNPYHPNEKITLRQLATHTSSITDRWSVYMNTYHFGGRMPEQMGEFLKSYFVPGGKNYSKENFLDAGPGTNRQYSNIGASLAGYIVEIAVKAKLNVYTKQTIFTPLQMRNTGWTLTEIAPDRHSNLYVAQDGWAIPIQLYEGTTYPDGGVRTSVSDLARFFIALLNDGIYESTRILDKRWMDEMVRFQFTDANKPTNVDLKEINSGLFWATKLDVTRIGHNGSDPGVRTEMLANLAKDLGVILFMNTSLPERETIKLPISRELWKYAETLKETRAGRD